LKNDFDREELKKWYLYNYKCWWCGRNTRDAMHHITGRDSNSILNSAPLCNFTCHINQHGLLRLEENMIFLLKKTVKYLLDQNYEFNEIDREFMSSHLDLFKKLL